MDIQTSLYLGNLVTLGSIDHEKDPEIESRWAHDPGYLRMLSTDPARPLSVAAVKKRYEEIEKEVEEGKNSFRFQIRSRATGESDQPRLIGFISLKWIEWNHGNAFVEIGIGDPTDRHKGYGTDAMRLILRYAFTELNLFRLSAWVPEYNQPALGLFHKLGFVQEVCRRKALYRDNQAWDFYLLGLLRDEWEKQKEGINE